MLIGIGVNYASFANLHVNTNGQRRLKSHATRRTSWPPVPRSPPAVREGGRRLRQDALRLQLQQHAVRRRHVQRPRPPDVPLLSCGAPAPASASSVLKDARLFPDTHIGAQRNTTNYNSMTIGALRMAAMTISGLVVGTYLAVLLGSGGLRVSPHARWSRCTTGTGTGGRARPGRFSELPAVTVQLPLFNEMYVVERLLDAVAGIRYPRDRFQIQVLDDSHRRDAGDLQAQGRRAARAAGLDIELHPPHRPHRLQGGRARRTASQTAKGEFVLIFDADFVPTPDILERTHRPLHRPEGRRWCSAAGSTSTATTRR